MSDSRYKITSPLALPAGSIGQRRPMEIVIEAASPFAALDEAYDSFTSIHFPLVECLETGDKWERDHYGLVFDTEHLQPVTKEQDDD